MRVREVGPAGVEIMILSAGQAGGIESVLAPQPACHFARSRPWQGIVHSRKVLPAPITEARQALLLKDSPVRAELFPG